jgi:hypothetical protein
MNLIYQIIFISCTLTTFVICAIEDENEIPLEEPAQNDATNAWNFWNPFSQRLKITIEKPRANVLFADIDGSTISEISIPSLRINSTTWILICGNRLFWQEPICEKARLGAGQSEIAFDSSQLKEGSYRMKRISGEDKKVISTSDSFRVLQIGNFKKRSPFIVERMEIFTSKYNGNLFVDIKLAHHISFKESISIKVFSLKTEKKIRTLKTTLEGSRRIDLQYKPESEDDIFYVEIHAFTSWFHEWFQWYRLIYRNTNANVNSDFEIPEYHESEKKRSIKVILRSDVVNSRLESEGFQKVSYKEPLYGLSDGTLLPKYNPQFFNTSVQAYDIFYPTFSKNAISSAGVLYPSDLRSLYLKKIPTDGIIYYTLKEWMNDKSRSYTEHEERYEEQICLLEPALISMDYTKVRWSVNRKPLCTNNERYYILPYWSQDESEKDFKPFLKAIRSNNFYKGDTKRRNSPQDSGNVAENTFEHGEFAQHSNLDPIRWKLFIFDKETRKILVVDSIPRQKYVYREELAVFTYILRHYVRLPKASVPFPGPNVKINHLYTSKTHRHKILKNTGTKISATNDEFWDFVDAWTFLGNQEIGDIFNSGIYAILNAKYLIENKLLDTVVNGGVDDDGRYFEGYLLSPPSMPKYTAYKVRLHLFASLAYRCLHSENPENEDSNRNLLDEMHLISTFPGCLSLESMRFKFSDDWSPIA